MKILTVDGKSIEYSIQYKSIKHLYFRSVDGKIYISSSRRYSENQIVTLMKNKFDKLIKMVSKKSRLETHKYSLWGVVLDEESFFQKYMLQSNDRNYQWILMREVELKIQSLKNQLTSDLSKLNLYLVETKIKPLKTKYGSCQFIKQLITINSFMARIPEIYLYYVLLHEYAHLLVPNHSKKFYQVLDQIMPNHKNIQKALRKHVISF